MQEPLVSIIIPCYNAANTLKKTLVSVGMEAYSNYEVIVVDDGSTDESFEIINEFEKMDHRFKGVRQPQKGVSAARNRGIRLARGEYIGFLDADDLFLKNSLSKRMRVFIDDDDPDMVGVFCPAVMIDSKGEVLSDTLFCNYSLPFDRLYFSTMPDCVFAICCVIARKKEIEKAGGFDENLSNGEDYDLWHRVLRGGGYFRYVDSCRVAWTQHPKSVSHTGILKHHTQCKMVLQRIFSTSTNGAIPEYRDGFGNALFHLNLTKRAFWTAVMAVVTGQYHEAKEIALDISKDMLQQIAPIELEHMVKYTALRALCKPEGEWEISVWPSIRTDMMRFITELNDAFGGNCISLIALRNRLGWSNRSDAEHDSR